jgi:hypothetical protein
MSKVYFFLVVFYMAAVGLMGQTQEVLVEASKDNSIYEEGELSNGAGQFLFTGVTNQGNKRRALVKFNPSPMVPEGVSVDSAFLILVPSLVKTDGTTVTIYRLNTSWGEGTANADSQEGKGATASESDATWTKTSIQGDPWVKPGGDFDIEPIASTIVSLGTDALFGSPLLTLLVNSWIADPTSNHGVIVIGDESENATAIRFNSRDYPEPEVRPMLKLYFQEAASAIPVVSGTENLFVFLDNASGEMVIKNNPGMINSRIELYSITGSLIFSDQQQMPEGETRINAGLENSGIYLYRIISEAGIHSGKLMFHTR